MPEFVKRNADAPRGFFACEAAGLAWLGGVAGGVPCARVLRHDETSLTLERLRSAPTDVEAARAAFALQRDGSFDLIAAREDGQHALAGESFQ